MAALDQLTDAAHLLDVDIKEFELAVTQRKMKLPGQTNPIEIPLSDDVRVSGARKEESRDQQTAKIRHTSFLGLRANDKKIHARCEVIFDKPGVFAPNLRAFRFARKRIFVHLRRSRR